MVRKRSKNVFDELKKLDELSELRDRVDDRYKPIVDAKIAYCLQQLHKPMGIQVMQRASESHGR